MSYKRTFRRTIAVHYSGSKSYPASQHGGTVHYSGVEYEDVEFEVHVDTDLFDHEVNHCNQTVGILTGSIVATEAAQVASIHSNSRKVADTIISGFFKTVRSEVSQQIMELSTKIDATLLHLNQMAKRCKEKQLQMQNDYARITSRYTKVFDDLNKELENRIFELDRPAFMFKRSTDENASRLLDNDMVATAAITGMEQGSLEARLSSSLVKRRAVDSLSRANTFLIKQKRTENILNSSMMAESQECSYYLPVCYLETQDNGVIDRRAYKSDVLNSVNDKALVESINNSGIKNELAEETTLLEEGFNREVSAAFDSNDTHSKRVMDYVTKLFYGNIK